jgi:hypothetical protein
VQILRQDAGIQNGLTRDIDPRGERESHDQKKGGDGGRDCASSTHPCFPLDMGGDDVQICALGGGGRKAPQPDSDSCFEHDRGDVRDQDALQKG